MGDGVIERVRSAISAAGLTQAELADRIGIGSDKLSKSLSGTRRFTSTELAELASVCRVSIDWLLVGEESPSPRMAARVSESMLSNETQWAALAEEYASADETLERLGYQHVIPPLPPKPATTSFVHHGQVLAHYAIQAFREAGYSPWDDGLIEHIEDLFGVDVAIVNLPQSFHGFTWQTDSFRLICVAASTNWARQRFTLAHELGHILSNDAHGELIGEVAGSDWSHYFTEKSANAFAGYFLMPPEEVGTAHAQLKDRDEISALDELAWKFKVSPAALSARLEKLQLLTADQRRALAGLTMLDVATLLGKETEFDRESALSARVRAPRRLTQQLRAAARSGATSVRQLARLLGMSPDDYLASTDYSPGLREVELMLDDDESGVG